MADAAEPAPLPSRPKPGKPAGGSSMIFTILLAIAFAVFAGTVIFQMVWRDEGMPEPANAEAGPK